MRLLILAVTYRAKIRLLLVSGRLGWKAITLSQDVPRNVPYQNHWWSDLTVMRQYMLTK